MATGRIAPMVTLIASLFFTASAAADTAQVTTISDDSSMVDCTLRDAIEAVTLGNAINGCDPDLAAGTDTITFAPSLSGQTITLSAAFGQLVIDDPDEIEIVGPGMSQLTIDGNLEDRVLALSPGRTASISGLSIVRGSPGEVGGTSQGGGIRNEGDLTLTDVRVAENQVNASSGSANQIADGAGIHNAGGSLTLDSAVVEDNTATATNALGDATTANVRGAGIMNQAALTIDDSVVSGNLATATDDGAMGGAFASAGLAAIAGSTFTVAHSTFSGNTATANQTGGGAARAVGGVFSFGEGSFELSTVAGNIADPSALITLIAAGGIFNGNGTASFRSSTIALNGPTTGPQVGVNVYVQGGAAVFTNAIISDPRGGGLNCVNLGSFGGDGFNVDYSPGGPSCPMGGDTLISNPMLAVGGLTDNGGPTPTIALQPASPAIDAGLSTADTDPTHDQRGFARPVDFTGISNAVGGNGADIGSYEVQLACAGEATPGTGCPSGGGSPPAGPTGKRAAALKKCKKISKKKKKKRKKCINRAKKLPV